MEWFTKVIKQYADFSGRARRQEYWMFYLFYIIFAIVIGVVEGIIGSPGIVGIIYTLALLIPSIAVGVRRLHDTGRSGWWMLLLFIPLVGALILLIFFVQEGEKEDNGYGADPKMVAA